eukprot:403362548
MSQAREYKMKEYFTSTVNHESIHATDLSGDRTYKMTYNSTQSRSRERVSPIRLTDTFRTTMILGEDQQSSTSVHYSTQQKIVKQSSYSTVQNEIVDQQQYHRDQYQTHTSSLKQKYFSNSRSRSPLQNSGSKHNFKGPINPSDRELSSEQQRNITLANQRQYSINKDRCGNTSYGAKSVLNSDDIENNANFDVKIYETQKRQEKSGMRNLDSNLGIVIGGSDQTENQELIKETHMQQKIRKMESKLFSLPYEVNFESIKSQQKKYSDSQNDKRNEFETSYTNPFNKQVKDISKNSHSRSSSRNQIQKSASKQIDQISQNEQIKLVYDLEINSKESTRKITQKDLSLLCSKVELLNPELNHNYQTNSQLSKSSITIKDAKDGKKSQQIIEYLKQQGYDIEVKSRYTETGVQNQTQGLPQKKPTLDLARQIQNRFQQKNQKDDNSQTPARANRFNQHTVVQSQSQNSRSTSRNSSSQKIVLKSYNQQQSFSINNYGAGETLNNSTSNKDQSQFLENLISVRNSSKSPITRKESDKIVSTQQVSYKISNYSTVQQEKSKSRHRSDETKFAHDHFQTWQVVNSLTPAQLKIKESSSPTRTQESQSIREKSKSIQREKSSQRDKSETKQITSFKKDSKSTVKITDSNYTSSISQFQTVDNHINVFNKSKTQTGLKEGGQTSTQKQRDVTPSMGSNYMSHTTSSINKVAAPSLKTTV